MNYKVNDVLKLIVTWRDTRFTGVFKNILHFRGVEATMDTEEMDAYLADRFPDYLSRVFDSLCTETFLAQVQAENLTDNDQPVNTKTYTPGDFSGSVVADDDDVPQCACCITRKSFRRGRESIGHIYVGPLPSIYTSEGLIVDNPLLVSNFNDVLDAYGDPLEDSVTGWEARPVVCNAAGTSVVPNSDVRTQSIAIKTVYLKSRRWNIGE